MPVKPRITPQMLARYIDEKQKVPRVVDNAPLELPVGFSAAKIFDDPTPNAVINHRIMVTFMQLSQLRI
jgi:hypothetical protein